MIHSVVIPTRNHPGSLRETLTSLAVAEHPTDAWEVVVVDNSDDDLKPATRAAVEAFDESHFRYVAMEPLGLMAARHLGVEVARGSVVSWIDDDEDVAPTWFRGVIECMERHGATLVTGPFTPAYGGTPPAWLEGLWETSSQGRHLAFLTLLDWGSEDCEIAPLTVWGGNLSVPRSVFYAAGGSLPDYMPPSLRDFQGPGECGLTERIGAMGLTAWYTPLCEVTHHVPAERMTLEYMRRRAFTVGIEWSFAAYRREHGLGPEGDGGAVRSAGEPLRAVARKIGLGKARGAIRDVQRQRTLERALRHPESAEAMRLIIRHDTAAGYAHHRRALERSHELREWALRPDYLGAQGIPPGAGRPTAD